MVAVVLAMSGTWPASEAWLWALGGIIVLGVPHGALDGEIARPWLRPWFGRAWFAIFSVPYLALAAGVLGCWRAAPVVTLAGFLAASVWHFGVEDADSEGGVGIVARGGLPIALPVLLHPAATARVLGTVAGVEFVGVPGWLWWASLAWVGVFSVWVVGRAWWGGERLGEVGLLAGAFAVLPPLTAFAIYFVCVHGPRHMGGLIGHPVRAPRVRSVAEAIGWSLPLTAVTLAIGAGLWPFYAGDGAARLLALTLQGLSALTLPHMVLEGLVARAERKAK